jgi:hypothetical protein
MLVTTYQTTRYLYPEDIYKHLHGLGKFHFTIPVKLKKQAHLKILRFSNIVYSNSDVGQRKAFSLKQFMHLKNQVQKHPTCYWILSVTVPHSRDDNLEFRQDVGSSE